MATIKKLGLGANQFGGFTPYGNLTTLRAKLQTNAAGAVIGGNASLTTALAIADVIVLEKLPGGMVLEDAQVIVSTNRGEPLTLNGSNSPASRAYSNVARRLLGEEVPLIDPSKERRGLRAKLGRLMSTKIF